MMNKNIKVYHVPKYHVVLGPGGKGDIQVVLADDAYNALSQLSMQRDELAGALSDTLDKIREFRVWYEASPIHPDEGELINAISRLGLIGRAESVLEKIQGGDVEAEG